MLLLGDIGNTDTKICLINDNLKIVKRVIISSKKFKREELNSFFKHIDRSIDHNSLHPCAKCGVASIFINIFKNINKGLLNYIFSFIPIIYNSIAHIQHGFHIQIVKLKLCCLIITFCRFDQMIMNILISYFQRLSKFYAKDHEIF